MSERNDITDDLILVVMYLSSTLPMWAALQALTYWVSVRPELINPCKTPNKKDTSVSLHNVNLTKKTEKITTFTSNLLCTFHRWYYWNSIEGNDQRKRKQTAVTNITISVAFCHWLVYFIAKLYMSVTKNNTLINYIISWLQTWWLSI